MNAVRRKKLKESIDKLSAIKYSIENVRFQEEDALENIPENFQGTGRAYKIEDAIDSLDDAIKDIDSAISDLEKAVS